MGVNNKIAQKIAIIITTVMILCVIINYREYVF